MIGQKKLSPVAEQALEWMLLLRSGHATATDFEQFQAWRNLDIRHEAAAAHLANALAMFTPAVDPASRKIVRDMLVALPPRRNALKSLFGFTVAAATTSYLANRFVPLDTALHDLRTATAERRTIQLEDGSTLILNARSIADLEFSTAVRGIRLHQGEALINLARTSAHPFSVTTRNGAVHALGHTFSVGVREHATNVYALSSEINIMPKLGKTTHVTTGYKASFNDQLVLSIEKSPADEVSWVNGQIVAMNQPLADVVKQLRPYYKGWISVSKNAEPIRVSGVFQLDRIDQAINSLVEAAPIEVRRHAGIWVSIEKA